MTSAFSWQNFVNLWPALFCTPRPNLPVTPRSSWLPTFEFQSSIMERTSFWVLLLESLVGFPGGSNGKNSPAMQDPWVRKTPWKRKWQPTPVILPGEFHEQRSLAGYSPWDCKESGMTEQLSLRHALLQVLAQFICLSNPLFPDHNEKLGHCQCLI